MSGEEERRKQALSRRRFLQGAGGALGGTILTLYGGPALARGGGGGRRGVGGIPPNGYNFYRVLTTGSGFSASLTDFSAAVMMSRSEPFIFLHGTDTGGNDGVWLAIVSYGAAPTVSGITSIFVQNTNLSGVSGVPSDQTPVRPDRIGTGDTNAFGNFATTIQSIPPTDSSGELPPPTPSEGQGVFLVTGGIKTRIAYVGDPAPVGTTPPGAPGAGVYGSVFGDVSLYDDKSVAFTAIIAPPGDSGAANDVAVYVPQGDPSKAFPLVTTGDLLPETSATITSLGLLDVASDGGFVVQVNAGRRDPGAPDRRDGTAIVAGNVHRPGRRLRLIAASPHLLSGRTGRHRDVTLGESHFGPRIAPGGRIAHVTHTTSHLHQLVSNEQNRRGPQILDRNRPGAPGEGPGVAALGGPVLGEDDDLTYWTCLLDDGTSQLVVSDGTSSQVVLQSNLDSSGNPDGDFVQGAQITEILQGYHPTQVDDEGRIVFAAEFLKKAGEDPNDPSNVEASIVIGIPA